MSVTHAISQVEYPESDGKPMGETDLHRYWMMRILQILQYRYREQRVYVASDLLVYYEQGDPKRYVVPDNLVALNCDPGMRRVFKTWEEGQAPDVVFEVTSRRTRQQDQVVKPQVYKQIGVKEYFLYDPTQEYLNPPLQGYRLTEGELAPIVECDGTLTCRTLGIELGLSGRDLVIIDAQSRAHLLTRAEDAERQLEIERQAMEFERQARGAEQAAREAAEARVRQLEKELKQIKGE